MMMRDEVEVWLDKEHTKTAIIKLLDYSQRELLKSYWGLQPDVFIVLCNWAHYHRFLDTIFSDQFPGPSFLEYIEWKNEYPGWSFAKLTPSHVAWNSKYEGTRLPMNQHYTMDVNNSLHTTTREHSKLTISNHGPDLMRSGSIPIFEKK